MRHDTGSDVERQHRRPGAPRAGVAAVTFDAIGRACVYQQGGGAVIADIQGYFTRVAFEDVADNRLLDTRTATRPTAGSMLVVHSRASSYAVVSLTATGSSAPGYLQVVPCGTAPGQTSNLNLDRPGQTRATLAIVPFAADGTACVYSSRGDRHRGRPPGVPRAVLSVDRWPDPRHPLGRASHGRQLPPARRDVGQRRVRVRHRHRDRWPRLHPADAL